MYQAGTLSGHPLAMASGLATLELLDAEGFHATLAERTAELCAGLEAEARRARVPFTTNHVCGMFGLFFTAAAEVTSFAEVMACDVARFRRFFHLMLDAGVNLAPSAFEAGFVSSAHGHAEVAHTLAKMDKGWRSLQPANQNPDSMNLPRLLRPLGLQAPQRRLRPLLGRPRPRNGESAGLAASTSPRS